MGSADDVFGNSVGRNELISNAHVVVVLTIKLFI